MAGSMDSIEKSQFNSSNEEETQRYDIYETHNPAANEAINHGFDLSYRNQGKFVKTKILYCNYL